MTESFDPIATIKRQVQRICDRLMTEAITPCLVGQATAAIVSAESDVPEYATRPMKPLWVLMNNSPWSPGEGNGPLYANELRTLRAWLTFGRLPDETITISELHALLTTEIDRADNNEGDEDA